MQEIGERMITIWKYKISLEYGDKISIEMPSDNEILSVGVVNDELFMWVRLDTESQPARVKLRVCGTGHECPEDGRFLGTAIMFDGQLVLHVFRVDGAMEFSERRRLPVEVPAVTIGTRSAMGAQDAGINDHHQEQR